MSRVLPNEHARLYVASIIGTRCEDCGKPTWPLDVACVHCEHDAERDDERALRREASKLSELLR